MPSKDCSIESSELIHRIRLIQAHLRDRVCASLDASSVEQMSRVAAETSGDTLYAVDRIGEDVLREAFGEGLADVVSFVLVGEGLDDGGEVFPDGVSADDAELRVIVDPIDGTRGLMYDKRSAWVLAGIARNRGDDTCLSDIFAAVQTEIPTSKQYLCDVLWATRGGGASGERYDRIRKRTAPLSLRPSLSETVEHGFAMLSRFFPGGKDILAAMEERLAEELIGPVERGRARLFEDQYICTGGQLYELMAGHDRFNADLRPLLEGVLAERGEAPGISCHPYDICTGLIAEEAGVCIATPLGEPLRAPLNTTAPIAWAGYANKALRQAIEPVLQRLLSEFGLSMP